MMLGKLHASLKGYPLPLDMSDKRLASFSAGNMIAQYDTLIDIANAAVFRLLNIGYAVSLLLYG